MNSSLLIKASKRGFVVGKQEQNKHCFDEGTSELPRSSVISLEGKNKRNYRYGTKDLIDMGPKIV